MKVLIVTDAWEPQVNGVVRTYQNTIKHIHGAEVIHPYTPGLKRIPMPGYKEIELVTNPWKIKSLLWVAMYECKNIHIATEGPLGIYARNLLNRSRYRYTTSFHTMFPEYIQTRFKIPASWTYPFFRWFHSKSKHVLVATNSMKTFLFNTATMICATKITEELFMLEEHNPINEHFSLPHIGIEILSMSKRIMNRVMCLAEDLNIKINI